MAVVYTPADTATKVTTGYPKRVKITNTNTSDAGNAAQNIWNTGLSAAGDPHYNEDPANTGKAVVTGTVGTPFVTNTASVTLFKSNQTIVLKPQEGIVVEVNTPAEYFYYHGLKGLNGALTVADDPDADDDTE